MAAKPPDAFLSYTRFDDQHEGGAISEFRNRLASAVRAVTGEPFEIFQDVDGIGLGQHWPGKLDRMLEEARFFIPILTPSYFKSKACRDELEKFLKAEERSGRRDLILPIYYIQCPVLEDEELRQADHFAVAIHQRQRWEWRDLRHYSFRSRKVRLKIEELALQIDQARQRGMRERLAPQPSADVQISAARPEPTLTVAPPPRPGSGVAAAPSVAAVAKQAKGQREFDVILATVGDKKINVIKEVREITGLGLAEAKDLVEAAPQPVSRGVSKEQARKIKEQLEAAGATVQVKPGIILHDIDPGISAEMPVIASKQVQGQKEFDVILATVGDKKINVIKEVREITGLGLAEAKDLVEAAPQPVSRGVSKEQARKIKEQLEAAGARVHIESAVSTASRLEPGTVFRDLNASWCPEMVVIPPGEFIMGSPQGENGRHESEGPQHLVKIGYTLAVGRYPLTFDEYDYFASVTGREQPGDEGRGRGRRPVVNVSWHDAKAYVEWLASETERPYRLLSEAEWEYACRAGMTTRFWWGDEVLPERANLIGAGPSEVGSYPPNPWGLYDMHGNVWEWVEDCWNDSYQGAPDDGSAWMTGDWSSRVLRGGSWNYNPRVLFSADRYRRSTDDRTYFTGFRVARMLTP